MFTGLIEDLGTLRSRALRGPGAVLVVGTSLGQLVLGESIAVQGVCLTVERIVAGGFEASASSETLERSTLGAIPLGAKVQIERALAAHGRLGGHIVAGHVDGIGTVIESVTVGETRRLTFRTSHDLSRFIAEKGSIAIDGASLTVNHVHGDDFDLVIVPHTQKVTLLGSLTPGAKVNVEVDILARYVARYLEHGREGVARAAGAARPGTPGMTVTRTRSNGDHEEHGERPSDEQQRDQWLLERLRNAGFT